MGVHCSNADSTAVPSKPPKTCETNDEEENVTMDSKTYEAHVEEKDGGTSKRRGLGPSGRREPPGPQVHRQMVTRELQGLPHDTKYKQGSTVRIVGLENKCHNGREKVYWATGTMMQRDWVSNQGGYPRKVYIFIT